ncbi:MAG TPA: MFS transporter [Candidatus Acetothermia bacterium]|nr:MFS transporter [Candidatus Acetothermia bacterium]
MAIPKDLMYHKFRAYGFLKNLRFFDPFLILFFRETGLTFLEIGTLFSIREIATNVLEIPTGIVADSYGRRRSMLASFSSYLLSFALFYLFPSFGIYALAMLLFAFGEAFRSGTHKALILEYLHIKGIEGQKVEYYGHTRAASQFGSAIAALIAAGLVFHTGSYRIVFLASIAPYLLELLLMLSYPKELDGILVGLRGGGMKEIARQIRSTAVNSFHMLRKGILLRGLLSSASFDALFKSTKDYLQPVLQSLALALPVLLSLSKNRRVAIVVGIIYFFIYLGTSYAASHAGMIQQRVHSLTGAANMIYVVGIILLAAGGIGVLTHLYILSIIGFLGLYLLQNARRPLLVGYLADLIPRQMMATGLSVESQLRTLLIAALAPMIGLMADRLGIGAAITIIALMGALAFPLVRIHEIGRR